MAGRSRRGAGLAVDPQRCGGGPIVFDDGHHKFALGAWWFMGLPEEVHAWIGRTAVAGGMVDGPR
jgi:hypothetical protein